jgi:dGTPase
MVHDVIQATMACGLEKISASPEILDAARKLRQFLDDRVYSSNAVYDDFRKASKILTELYAYYLEKPDSFYREAGKNYNSGSLATDVCDFISGMTDRYAFSAYEKIFLPQPWILY